MHHTKPEWSSSVTLIIVSTFPQKHIIIAAGAVQVYNPQVVQVIEDFLKQGSLHLYVTQLKSGDVLALTCQ